VPTSAVPISYRGMIIRFRILTSYTVYLSSWSIRLPVTRANPAKNHSAKVLSESTVILLSSILPRLIATWKRRKSLIVARSGGVEPSSRLHTPVVEYTSIAGSAVISDPPVSRYFFLIAFTHLHD